MVFSPNALYPVGQAGAFWYVYNKIIQEESVQKRGCILVNFTFERIDIISYTLSKRPKIATELDSAAPIKLSAVHYCCNDVRMRPFVAMVQVALETSTRLRIQMHYGTFISICATPKYQHCNAHTDYAIGNRLNIGVHVPAHVIRYSRFIVSLGQERGRG